jgi:hypothetical protein
VRHLQALPRWRWLISGMLGLLVLGGALLWLGGRSGLLEAQSGYACSSAYRIDVTLPTGARWDMCWEQRSLEGIVLHDIHYTPPGGPRRLILASAGLAQIHVPYDDNGARFHDVSDYGLGGQFLLDLSPEECPEGRLLSYYTKNVLCLQTPQRGYAYKYFNRHIQGHELRLFSVSVSGDYNYISAWRFTDDGVIEPTVGAAGKLQRYGSSERYGWRTAPNRVPISHTHNYYWKLDFDIDGLANDLVEEIEFIYEDGGRKLALDVEPIRVESARSVNPESMRSWRIRDKVSVNEEGHAISYHLDPIQVGHQFVGPAFEPWTHNDIYVTAVRNCERFTSHNPTVNGCGADVTQFVNGENVDGADIVVWYGISFHHLPRDEDELDMPVHWDGFQILPRDWMAESPDLGQNDATPSPTRTSTPTSVPASPVPPTLTPTPTATPTPALTATPMPGSCRELLVNSDFEGADGWSFGSTPERAAYVSDPVYAGGQAVRQGIAPGATNRYAHSSVYQRITLPADTEQAILSLQEYAGGAGEDADYREVLLLDSSYRLLAFLDREQSPGGASWQASSFDVSAFRGRTVVVYLNVYNNGSGPAMWRALDNVSLISCTGAARVAADPVPAAAFPAAASESALVVAPAAVALLDDVEQGAQIVRIDSKDESVPWHAATSAGWLRLSAPDGQTPGELILEFDPKGLADGLYQTTVTLTSPHLVEQEVELTVTARVGDGFTHFLPLIHRE